MNYRRFRAIHFTTPVYQLEYGFCGPVPKPMDPHMNVVSVFHYNVWICVALSSVTISAVFMFSYRTFRQM